MIQFLIFKGKLYSGDIVQNISYLSSNAYTYIGNTDFDAGPHTVEFPINTTMALFNIPITVENILEIDENFTIRIDPIQLIPQVFLGNISEANGLIIDDDRKCNS